MDHLVPVTKRQFRLGDNLPRPVATDLHRRLAQCPNAEVTAMMAPNVWTILHSFESKEYRDVCKKCMCVGVPFVEQFLADPSYADRIPTDYAVFNFLLDPNRAIIFSEQFSKQEVTQWTKKVRWMGGSVAKTMSPNRIAIATSASVLKDSVYQQAVAASVQIAPPYWIEHLWSSKMGQDVSPLLPLQGLRLNGELAHDELKRTGAQIDQLEYCHVAVALTSSDDVVERAKSLQVPVVGTRWLSDSIMQGCALAVHNYPVPTDLPLRVSNDSFLEDLMVDVSLLPADVQPEARVVINNGGGSWCMSGELHEELQLINVVLVDVDEGETFMCPKSGNWLKQSIARGVPLLKRNWLNACADNMALTPWKKYKVDVLFTECEGERRFLRNIKSDAIGSQPYLPIEDVSAHLLTQMRSQTSHRSSMASKCPQIFAGYVLAICGDDMPSRRLEDSKRGVAAAGGELLYGSTLTSKKLLDYIILPDGKGPSAYKELENLGRLRKKNVVSHVWLYLCLRSNILLTVPNPLLPNLQPARFTSFTMKKIFEFKAFHLSNWGDSTEAAALPEEYMVKNLCKQLGATVCKHRAWNIVTHYIVMLPDVSMNDKYKEAKARNLPIVHYKWICEAYSKGCAPEIGAYLVNFEAEERDVPVDFYEKLETQVPILHHVIEFTVAALLADPNIVTVAQDAGAIVDLHGNLTASHPERTHVLVCANGESPPRSSRPVVIIKWLLDSVSRHCALPFDQFLPVQGATVKSGVRKRSRRLPDKDGELEAAAMANAERQLRCE